MRILAVLERLGAGGTEWQAVHILSALKGWGVEVFVVVLEPPPQGTNTSPMLEALERAQIPVLPLGLLHRWSVAEGAYRLSHLAHKLGADVVHGRLYFASIHVAATQFISPQLRRVVSFHNVIYDYPRQRLIDRVRKRVEGTLLRSGVHGLAAVSRTVGDSYSRHLKLSGVEIIPNAVPLQEIRAEPGDRARVTADYGMDPTAVWLLMPARFVFEKGHRYLIDALAVLSVRGVRVQALCVGRGNLLSNARELAHARGINRSIVFSDEEATRSEVLRLMDACDIVVLPSLFEGFPNVAAEAMAKGKPLVGTQIGGFADLAEDGVSALLVPPADGEALADALERLVQDPVLRQALGRTGRARVEDGFGVDTVAKRWLQFYERVMRFTPGAPTV